MSLKRSAAWTALDTFGSAGLSFGFRLLVARVLTPDQFGVAALALTVLAVLQTVNDFGLTASLIQKDEADVTPSLINTTFTASGIVSLVLAALTGFAIAPLAAWFYHQPQVGDLILVMAISLLPSPFTTVASALLLRQRRFREVALVRIAATILSLAIAGTILVVRPSPWAVVTQAITMPLIMVLGLCAAAKWRFRITLVKKHLKEVFGFSTFILMNDLAISLSANAGVFIIGRMVSASDAGLYSLANYMTDTVRRALMSILSRVTFVHFSQIKHDKPQLSQAYLSVQVWNSRVIFPIMTAFMLFGPALMNHFYGHRWDHAGSVVRWLSLAVIINAAGGATSNLYRAIGRPGMDLALFLTTTTLIQFPGMAFGAYFYGLTGVAMAAAITKLVAVILRQILLDRIIGGTALHVLRAVARLVLLQAPLVIVWAILNLYWPVHPWMADVAGGVLGCALYGLAEGPRAFPALARRVGLGALIPRSGAAG